MDWGYQSVANGLPDDEYTSYLRDTLKQSSSDIDGLTASRAKIRAEEDGLDAATEKGGAAGTLGAMLIPFLAGLAAPGGSDAMLGTAFSAAGKGGELYYNNLEADEKERRVLLNREIDATDKKMAAAELSQDRLMQNIGGLQEKRLMGQLPGTTEFTQLQAAENAKWQNQQNYAAKLKKQLDDQSRNEEIAAGMASGKYYYDPRLPAPPAAPAPSVGVGTLPDGSIMGADGTPLPPAEPTTPINPVWGMAHKSNSQAPLDPRLAAFVGESTGVDPDVLKTWADATLAARAKQIKQNQIDVDRRQQNLDMAKSGRAVFGWEPQDGANTDPGEVKKLNSMVGGVARLDRISDNLVATLKQGGDSLTGQQSSKIKALMGEFNLGTKERSGAGAALTALEDKMYFSAIPALLANPMKSWGDIATQYGLNRDPSVAFEELKRARHAAVEGYMGGVGWQKIGGDNAPSGNSELSALAELSKLLAQP